ncbi:polysaccharide export protein [Parvularcula flava]|uniref:Polysaccharide export protein n=1 Tax=Aquisalinus luteolus TaxID=1566827 RepID=A0A8J3A6E3_9PROT|nr:polysaccharide biosynthesis/export family protein [Aquisalinus luteolus]NHK29482.1 polysaccharide export protein [Aquisalinus luteolus]GGI01811.1 polysaccharide export protein [Aquisalinus luteolus]
MRALISVFIAMFMLAACQSSPVPPAQGPATAQPAVAAQDIGASDHGSLDDYRLGSGDKLRVIVFEEEGLSGEFQVDGSGLVSMPLVGEIRAAGQTVRQFEVAVEDSLRGAYLRDPRVSAEVLDFRPYYILGEVNRPGTYPYISGLTVLNAVATAEGFTYRANQRNVYIRRAGEGEEQRYPLSSTTQVNPGDTIRIGERIF